MVRLLFLSRPSPTQLFVNTRYNGVSQLFFKTIWQWDQKNPENLQGSSPV
jgi:hypothetical protein